MQQACSATELMHGWVEGDAHALRSRCELKLVGSWQYAETIEKELHRSAVTAMIVVMHEVALCLNVW